MARGKFRRKRENKRMRITMIEDLQLQTRITNRLKDANIFTLADLITYSKTELAKIPGIGPSALESIMGVVHQNEAHLKDE